MRLFIAINFTEEIKQMLVKDIARLKEHAESGNFTLKDNLHLTVAFLGEVPQKGIKDIKEAMEACIESSSAIKIKGFGKFKSGGENLYWRGIECAPEVVKMQKGLIKELKIRGFEVDEKPFKPHITMGRRCIMKEGFSERNFNSDLGTMEMDVTEICLMKSERMNGRMVYTPIAVTELK